MIDILTGLAALIVWLIMAYVGAYDSWKGYDLLAHFVVGYALGMGAALFVGDGVYVTVAAALVFTTVLSVIWEAVEFSTGTWPWVERTSLSLAWDDTGGDIAAVALGASQAGIVVFIV